MDGDSRMDILGVILTCVIVHCVSALNSPSWLIIIVFRTNIGKILNINYVCSGVIICSESFLINYVQNDRVLVVMPM